MTVLSVMIVWIAAIVRGIAAGYVVVQVLIWHAYYLDRPWTLWGPAVAVAWGCGAIAYLRHYPPRWPVVCVDTAVYVALGAAAGWCVPLAIRGVAGSWLFIVVASQLIMPIWFTPRRLALVLALASATAFWAGTMLAPMGGDGGRSARAASVALLLVLIAVHWCGRRMLYRRAARADDALAAADVEARDQYVLHSRNIERREQDRLLHDTVLNTLTAIGRSGDAEAVRSACRHSIGLLEDALSEPGELAAGSQPGGDPLAAIRQAVNEMRARGLVVQLEVTDGAAAVPVGVTVEDVVSFPAPAGASFPVPAGASFPVPAGASFPVPAGASFPVPAGVVTAMAHATREALMNVAQHARTGEAWVSVSVTQPGNAAADGLIQVTIRDAGAGFDPGRVELVRLGVRRSIIERVADVGGSASVQSAPGKGTTVSLSWPAAPPRATAPAPQPAGAAARQGRTPW
jgi:signal transduction histidine kinase